MPWPIVIAGLVLFYLPPIDAKTPRSAAAALQFKRHNPCPATGERRGNCPGYVIDHIRPLCAGGPDEPGNMQWQDLTASKIKDRQEARECRALRRAEAKTVY